MSEYKEKPFKGLPPNKLFQAPSGVPKEYLPHSPFAQSVPPLDFTKIKYTPDTDEVKEKSMQQDISYIISEFAFEPKYQLYVLFWMRAGGKINHGYDARLVFNEWLEAGYKPEWITEVVEMAKAVKVYNLYKPNSISLLMEAHSRSHPLSKEVSKEVSKEGKK